MIDLHIHCLPGIDDGAENLEEAAEMCRIAVAAGCETLVATPHQRHDSWPNLDAAELERLRRQVVERVGPRPRLLLGGEIRVDANLLEDLDAMPGSGVLPLAGSRYLLVELSRGRLAPDPEWLVHELVVAGWRPVIAHPEFIPALTRDAERAAGLVEAGALLQVTAMSVTGEFGPRTARYVRTLFAAGLVHVVASDAHGARWRPPGLRRAHQVIARDWGVEVAERVTTRNPRAIVENRPIDAIPQPT